MSTPIPKTRKDIPIKECHEALAPIPMDGTFAFFSPHPYEALGAPYGDVSPFSLREGVLFSLMEASKSLHKIHPGYRLRIFDAYRPIEVQAFMVDYVADGFLRETF